MSGIPRAAWVCAALACLNAVCWSLITPPFQVTDEPDHIAYVQQLAEHGRLPVASAAPYSLEEGVALEDLHYQQVRQHPGKGLPPSSSAAQQQLQADLQRAKGVGGQGDVSAGLADSQPPLYYALATVPYELGSSGSLLDRLALVRLLSALMAAATALFAFLFLRETLPGVPWSWTVGGLGVALFPLLGFMSGGVTSDAMLYAVTTALFFAMARAFRRGFTWRSAAAIGLVIAIGVLTKLNFVGLIPGAAFGLLALTARSARRSRRAALGSLAVATAVSVSPVCLYVLVHGLSSRLGSDAISGALEHVFHHGSLTGELSYIWQFYLPRLPGMHSDFAGLLTTRQVWFNGMVGLYGWLDTTFPEWVYDAALFPAALIAVLCCRELFTKRIALRLRWLELTTYLLMGAGLAVLVAANAYLEFPTELGNFAEPRYLLPLVGFWGLALALAARGAGRRWGPLVGAALVTVALAHDIFSQLLVISRFYG